jgi:hypothetical protein
LPWILSPRRSAPLPLTGRARGGELLGSVGMVLVGTVLVGTVLVGTELRPLRQASGLRRGGEFLA